MRKFLKKFSLLRFINLKIVYMTYLFIQWRYQKIVKLDELTIPLNSNILYVGTDIFQDESGFLQDLGELHNLYILKNEDKYGQYQEFELGPNNDKNCRFVNDKLKDLRKKNINIDIVLMQSWARLWNIDLLSEIKKKYGFRIINICMDDRHSFLMPTFRSKYNRGTSGLIPILDGSLVSAKECVNWYNSMGVKSRYFPEASSKKFFYKMPNIKKDIDVGFVGAKYGRRASYIEYLKANDVDVICYGSGWENGRLDNECVNKFFNRCKIVIGFGFILDSVKFCSLKLRDFDVPLSGSFYLTSFNEDLLDLFPGINKDRFFSSKDDMLAKVKYFLKNEAERETIADAMHLYAMQNHTYVDRFLECSNEK